MASKALEDASAVPVGFWRGLTYPFRGGVFVYLRHPGLVRFWIWPFVITLALFALIGWLSFHYAGPLLEWIFPVPDPEGGWWAAVLAALHDVIQLLLSLVLCGAGSALVVVLSMVLAGPFNDMLSEAVEKIRAGTGAPPFSVRTLLRDLLRDLRLELSKLLLYFLVMIPLGVFSLLVPGIGQALYSAFAFVFTALYFALDFIGGPATRRGVGVRARFAFLRRHLFSALGFGTGVWALLFVPVLNLLFLPAAVTGGTLLYLDLTEVPEPDALGS
jgi:CysZ protein